MTEASNDMLAPGLMARGATGVQGKVTLLSNQRSQSPTTTTMTIWLAQIELCLSQNSIKAIALC